MGKSLFEIEREYCIGVAEFFLSGVPGLIDYRDRKRANPKEVRNYIQEKIGDQLKSRLLDTRLILEYRVEANIYSLDFIRDGKIDSLLEGSDLPEENITVWVKYRNGVIDIIKNVL